MLMCICFLAFLLAACIVSFFLLFSYRCFSHYISPDFFLPLLYYSGMKRIPRQLMIEAIANVVSSAPEEAGAKAVSAMIAPFLNVWGYVCVREIS